MRTVPLSEVIEALPKEEQDAISERTAQLIAAVRPLAELRKAQKITQTELARRLGISQASVARIERRSDMLLSTLSDVISGMGGELVVLAKFKDVPAVEIRLGEPAARPASAKDQSAR